MSLRRFRKERAAVQLKPFLFTDRPAFYPLLVPLTSTSWDGDSHSTTAKTELDLTAVFGAPGYLKAVLLYFNIRDSGAAANPTWILVSPNNTASQGQGVSPHPLDDRWSHGTTICPCDDPDNHDDPTHSWIYYQIQASGSGTFDVLMEIWGYWI